MVAMVKLCVIVKELGLEERFHEALIFTSVKGLFLGNETIGLKLAKGFIHCDHADVFTGLHDAREHEGFSVANGRGNRRSIDE